VATLLALNLWCLPGSCSASNARVPPGSSLPLAGNYRGSTYEREPKPDQWFDEPQRIATHIGVILACPHERALQPAARQPA